MSDTYGRLILAVGGLIVVLIMGLVYVANMHEIEFESCQKQAYSVTAKCDGVEGEIVRTTSQTDQIKWEKDKVLKVFPLILARDEAQKKIASLKAERIAALQELSEMVKTVAVRDTSKTIPILTLKNGKTFQNVKLIGVNDTGIAIVHNEGASRLVESDLPENLKERFRLDVYTELASLLSELKPSVIVKTELTETKPTVDNNVASGSPRDGHSTDAPLRPSSPYRKSGTSADEQNSPALVAQANYLRDQINQLQVEQKHYLTEAHSLRQESSTSITSSGQKKIHSRPAEAVRLEMQASEISKKISTLEVQLRQVEAQFR